MNLDLAFYWKLLWRRMPVMALLVLLFGSLGVITAVKLPDTWSASARLLVEAPQIPENMVRSTVQTDANEQLDVVQQKLLTRANLIDIANRLNVFKDIREMDPDTVLREMRSATRVRSNAGRDKATVLSISFRARGGRIAAAVVNEYVTIVLEENTEIRMSRAENTLDFFNEEVRRLGEELDRSSAAIVAFKTENANALPEDQSYRLGRQALLQERLSRIERDLASAQARRNEIQNIYERTGFVQSDGSTPQLSPEEQQLETLRRQIDEALLTYSATHPSVIQLENRKAALEVRLAEAAPTEETEEVETSSNEDLEPQNALLEASLSEANSQINLLEAERVTTYEELGRLDTAISQTSSNGIQLAALQRDYENIQTRYSSALNNLNTAAMSERIETTSQGQRITVIENASVPSAPTGPNRTNVALMGAAVGIGLAAGYFVLLELLNTKIRRPQELVGRFNITPIATIPFMENRKRRMIRRGVLIGATLAVLIMVPGTLWYVDQNYLPLETFVQKGLQKMGLG